MQSQHLDGALENSDDLPPNDNVKLKANGISMVRKECLQSHTLKHGNQDQE